MFNILSMLLSGLVIGWAARFFYPGAVEMGLIKTTLLGVGGSLLAGLIASRGGRGDGVSRAGCLASILGAMLLIFLGRHLLT